MSKNRRPTVKQLFLDVSSQTAEFSKTSQNGHAIVVGGHATVGRMSNNLFSTFQAKWKNFQEEFEERSSDNRRKSGDIRPTVIRTISLRFKPPRQTFQKCSRTVTR